MNFMLNFNLNYFYNYSASILQLLKILMGTTHINKSSFRYSTTFKNVE